MTIRCAHDNCDCVAMAETLRQWRCGECGRYSKVARFDSQPEPGMVDDRVPGCWVTTGMICPECTAARDA